MKVLVDLLDEDYSEQTELVEHALNGIGNVFELQSPTTKNDFCRMFIREGLLDPLSAAHCQRDGHPRDSNNGDKDEGHPDPPGVLAGLAVRYSRAQCIGYKEVVRRELNWTDRKS